MERVQGLEYKQLFQVGQKVHFILEGGRDGIVYRIDGERTPETVQSLVHGCIMIGGSARLHIVFKDGVKAIVSESILRGLQWYIYDEVASRVEIINALRHAKVVQVARHLEAVEKAEARQKEKDSLPDRYPYLTTLPQAGRASSHALGSRNIRIELSRTFPGQPFRVKSKSYSGGCSIRVEWVDGPSEDEVAKIADRYQKLDFDAMEDIARLRDNVFSEVFGGANYVFWQREISHEKMVEVAREFGFTITFREEQWTPDGISREDYDHVCRTARDRSFYTTLVKKAA